MLAYRFYGEWSYGKVEWLADRFDTLDFYLFGDPGIYTKLMVLSAALDSKDTCGCVLVVISGTHIVIGAMTADSCLPWSPVAFLSLRYSLAPLPLGIFMGVSLHGL